VDFLFAPICAIGAGTGAHAGARRGAWWDANKIGVVTAGRLRLRGDGLRFTTECGKLLRALSSVRGVALFDLENPEKCLRPGDSWIFGPEASMNGTGMLTSLVFPCGIRWMADGPTLLNIYYGAADCSIALARARRAISTQLAGQQWE